MEDQELKKLGQDIVLGEDLYGVSVEQLKLRLDLLAAEDVRTRKEIAKKSDELSKAESFFKKN